MEDTLIVTRLGITSKLKLTLRSTTPMESMISTVRAINATQALVLRRDVSTTHAARMLEAETQFRKCPAIAASRTSR
jgi:hypothetical protein